MKAIHLAALTVLAAVSAWASSPVVSNVVLEQKSAKRAEITYTLSEDAVVTLDIVTNAPGGGWASIGAENVVKVWGDVNKLVTGSGTHTIHWAPDASWLDETGFGSEVKARVKAWATDAPPPYMVIDLEIASRSGSATADFIRYYESADQLPDGGISSNIYRTERLVMRRIPAKGVTWRMGAASNEKWYDWWPYKTPHYVTLTKDYYMAVFELTKGQTKYLDGSAPTTADNPMPKVGINFNSWRGDASTYDNDHVDPSSRIGVLRTLTQIDSFDFPTEAQWEYACRAGSPTTFSPNIDTSGNDAAIIANFAAIGWCEGGNSSSAVVQQNISYPVGQKLPNAWGLYDMHGNVKEWCLDWWQSNYDTASVVDPRNDTAGTNKALRGGSAGWCQLYYCASGARDYDKPSSTATGVIGCRLVCAATAH